MTDELTRRGFNWQIWAAPVVSVAGLLSFPMLFVRWPRTRDVPWVNVALFVLALWLLWMGVRRAAASERWRSAKLTLAGVMVVACAAPLAAFVLIRFVSAAQLPPSLHAPAVGERAPAFTLLDEHRRSVSLASLLSDPLPGGSGSPKGVMLIFYMYSGCRACNSEFHGVQRNLVALAARGVRPVAISIDDPDTSRRLSEEAGYTFTFLSDPSLDVIRRYDVADQQEGARPAEFLVGASGIVRWRYLTGNLFVRATPEQMLDAAARLP
jgi:peroxiredoxin